MRFSVVAVLLTLLICVRIYQETLFLNFVPSDSPPSPATHKDPGTWEVRHEVVPYMGNLTCPFEIAHWNLESFYRPWDREKRRACGKLRFVPHEGWVAPNASAIFDKLPHGATVYFLGDSMMCQQSVDFFCLMASISEMTSSVIHRLPPKNWCNGGNECEVDFGGFTGFVSAQASFRSIGPNKKDIRVVADIEYGRVGQLRTHLANAKKGDVYVMNQGLHTRGNKGPHYLLTIFNETRKQLISAKEKGANLVWRETTAAHFHTPDGYYSGAVAPLQKRSAAACVPSLMIDEESSRKWDDSGLVPLMESLGIPVIDAWEASFLAPEWCHVGQGKDCAHWLQPGGVTSFLSEGVLDYIINKV